MSVKKKNMNTMKFRTLKLLPATYTGILHKTQLQHNISYQSVCAL